MRGDRRRRRREGDRRLRSNRVIGVAGRLQMKGSGILAVKRNGARFIKDAWIGSNDPATRRAPGNGLVIYAVHNHRDGLITAPRSDGLGRIDVKFLSGQLKRKDDQKYVK